MALGDGLGVRSSSSEPPAAHSISVPADRRSSGIRKPPCSSAMDPVSTIVGGGLIMGSSWLVKRDLASSWRREVARGVRGAPAAQRRPPDDVPVLQASGIDFSYGQVQVLFDVGFEVRRGEVSQLARHAGAGKSTILRVVSGKATPERGVVRLNGRTATTLSPEQRVRLGVVSSRAAPGCSRACRCGRTWNSARSSTGPIRTTSRAASTGCWRSSPVRNGSASGPRRCRRAAAGARPGTGAAARPEVLLIDELSLGLSTRRRRRTARRRPAAPRIRSGDDHRGAVPERRHVHRGPRGLPGEGRIRFTGSAADLAAGDIARAVFFRSDEDGLVPHRGEAT
ncbi:ATP-binding cassette domain-containing protein [Yinghuangia aomiensis]